MKAINYSIIIASLPLSIGCSKENENEIETELMSYIQTFQSEAATHGVVIQLNEIDLDGYIENIEQRGTLGQCKSYSDGSKEIVLDEPYWNRANDLEREYLVFHELGHCILEKDHNDSKDADGHCISIMQSGAGQCDGIYTIETREQLLKELFTN